MDIQYYFKAFDCSNLSCNKFLNNKSSLGNLIVKNNEDFSSKDQDKYQIAIIGIPYDEKSPNKGTSTSPDHIRNFLYSFENINPKLKIIDLGNLKKGNKKNDIYFALRDIIDYLKALNIVTIVLGGGQDLSIGIARAFDDDKYFQMSTIDSRIDIKNSREPLSSLNYFSKILTENPNIFNINFIGLQSYFVPQKLFSKIEELQFDVFRLGQVRNNLTEIEPVLRDTNFLSFDISAVRQQDAPGFYDGSPNGLYSEEACQISRYAGLSDKLGVFGLFEVNPKKDRDHQTSKLAAQVIWYFLDGFNNRRNESPLKNSSGFTQFIVEIEEYETPFVFYNQIITNRWWMQMEDLNKNKILISCSEKDYKMAAKKEIPLKWLKFIQKIDNVSK